MALARLGGGSVVARAIVLEQRGDNDCLFHSLLRGLQLDCTAESLRGELVDFIVSSAAVEVFNTGLSFTDWVRAETALDIGTYCLKMRPPRERWGGGIELAACSMMLRARIFVYVRGCTSGTFRLLVVFGGGEE